MTGELDGFERLRLVGDEDCGVGIECRDRDCWDGGRPLGYLGDDHYRNDPAVTVVATVPELLAVGRRHLDERHP